VNEALSFLCLKKETCTHFMMSIINYTPYVGVNGMIFRTDITKCFEVEFMKEMAESSVLIFMCIPSIIRHCKSQHTLSGFSSDALKIDSNGNPSGTCIVDEINKLKCRHSKETFQNLFTSSSC
jgi:hypothetical protein